jgi:hypothetical protein
MEPSRQAALVRAVIFRIESVVSPLLQKEILDQGHPTKTGREVQTADIHLARRVRGSGERKYQFKLIPGQITCRDQYERIWTVVSVETLQERRTQYGWESSATCSLRWTGPATVLGGKPPDVGILCPRTDLYLQSLNVVWLCGRDTFFKTPEITLQVTKYVLEQGENGKKMGEMIKSSGREKQRIGKLALGACQSPFLKEGFPMPEVA